MREVPQKEIRCAALAPDGRMLVVADRHAARRYAVSSESKSQRAECGGPIPPEDRQPWFRRIAGMQFESKPPWFNVAFRDGNVIRFNALTGREQRRFLAEWRTPEQTERRAQPRNPTCGRPRSAPTDARWSHPGGMDLHLGRRIRQHAPEDPASAQARLVALGLAPDGRTLATSDLRNVGDLGRGRDPPVRHRDRRAGLALEPGDGRASVMVFSPDGNRLFTGFGRGSGIVWDVRRGREAPRANE